ncbi:MAG: hypothetical protein FJ303_19450 [Planctomycetes bacterium]|nr:hypothetical protein [Planctomycetota bacterium]
MHERKSLTDILRGSSRDELQNAWNQTEAAGELGPLPAGDYVARIIAGELMTSRTNGTPGYRLTFRVCEGDYVGRRFWSEIWLTPAALPMAKRDLAKLGVTSLEQLERPLPQGIRCAVKLALRKSDQDDKYNAVKSFTVIGIDAPEVDPFAPSASGNGKPKEGGPAQ